MGLTAGVILSLPFAFSFKLPGDNGIIIVTPFRLSAVKLPTLSQFQALHDRVERMQAVIEELQSLPNDYGADARIDYALYTAGAYSIRRFTSPSRLMPSHKASKFAISFSTDEQSWPNPWPRGPHMAMHHITAPGYCWPFHGTQGHLGINLARRIFIDEVTIDHVAEGLVWDRSSAPRHMSLWGFVDGEDDLERVSTWEDNGRIRGLRKHYAVELEEVPEDVQVILKTTLRGKWVPLTTMRYDLAADPVQTFPVDADVAELGVSFQTVMLVVNDNWGAMDFTCIYRVRVHGKALAVPPTLLTSISPTAPI